MPAIGFGVLVLIAWGIGLFNLLVRDRQRVREGWSGIDVQLKRRHDLLPKLVEAVKAYAGYEQRLLTEVTELRGKSLSAGTAAERGDREGALGLGIGRLLAVAEKYPDLKANQGFLDLQKSFTDTENQLQMARRYYNGTVRNFNTRLETFPSVLVARAFRFTPESFFQAEAPERAVPGFPA